MAWASRVGDVCVKRPGEGERPWTVWAKPEIRRVAGVGVAAPMRVVTWKPQSFRAVAWLSWNWHGARWDIGDMERRALHGRGEANIPYRAMPGTPRRGSAIVSESAHEHRHLRGFGRKTSTATGLVNLSPVRFASPEQDTLRNATSVGRPSR